MEKYLKDRTYYENLQDNFMIRACKRHVNIYKKKKFKDDKEKHAWEAISKIHVFSIKYHYYKKREDEIRDMMERDRKRDEMYTNSTPFTNKHCKKCNKILVCFDKTLDTGVLGKPDRMLFLYKCDNCDFRHGIYSDGEDFEVKRDKCKECDAYIKAKSKFEGDILTQKYECKECGAKYTETTDYGRSEEIDEEDIITDEDRELYGYNAKESMDLVSSFDGIKRFNESLKEQKEKDEKKDLYDKVKKLEHLNIVGIKKKIISLIEKTPFCDFNINSNKQVKGGLEIEFTIFYEGAVGDNSSLELKKLLKDSLKSTNWRLRENSLSEKMGVINGKMVGYDDEDELVNLIDKF